ncbi:hypothetical protein SAMN05443572_102178 [Myxococcus fulvus]|nr:hypothetical protein SAMN05443572_102178 [Myxococcus fulvus]
MTHARGPWAEVPAVEMPTGDSSIPISLLRDVAEALLKLPGAKACDPATRRPIQGLSTEYCSTVYVAGGRDSLSWRVASPVRGSHEACRPFFEVEDEDFAPSEVWVVGYVHNHPCAALPSSQDLGVWPTDVFKPFVAMAEVRLIPGNPAPALFKGAAIEMASALVAEQPDGTRFILRYFPTGEVQQWSEARARWVTLGTCSPIRPRPPFKSVVPQCSAGGLRLLEE